MKGDDRDETSEPTLYAPLKKNNNESDFSDITISPTPPRDTNNLVYLSLLSCGIGFILPYSSFIVAADYWQDRFKENSVAIDMSLTYILTACCTAFANSLTISIIPFKWRIMLGYSISFMVLVFITVCEVAFHVFSKTTAYHVCLLAVLAVSFGSTVQQSSFYGFSSAFPNKYTQALMAGESVAGFLVSTNRVLTKLLIADERLSTVIFFLTSIVYVSISFVLHKVSMKTPFVRFYLSQCSKKVQTAEFNMESYISDDNASRKVPMSFSNPLYNPSQVESSCDTTSQSLEIDKIELQGTSTATVTGNSCGIRSRWDVVKTIYPYMTSIAIAYFVTLSLYPGIESEIISCNLRSWMPVLLMFTFNTADVIGKILAAIPYPWTARQLILLSTLRIIIVPLLLLCCAPRKRPIIHGEIPSFAFTAVFGLTNGLSGSLPIILAPNKVPSSLKEIAGNLMTLSYNLGMAFGSIMGYLFDRILGEAEDITSVCPVFPYAPYPAHMPTTTEKAKTVITSTLFSILNVTTTAASPESTFLSSFDPVQTTSASFSTFYYESTIISTTENDTYL